MIVVLGADGMLGHAVLRELADAGLDVVGTTRARGPNLAMPHPYRVRGGVDVLDAAFLDDLDALDPEVVVNCVGLVRQRVVSPENSRAVNAVLPHRLAAGVRRLVHVSTDCVFSGDRGWYSESDVPDAHDPYGADKALGEVRDRPNTLTLRTSIVGREVQNHLGLLEWFLRASSPDAPAVLGYVDHRWNGVTTRHLARVVRRAIVDWPKMWGLVHVTAAEPVTKYDLLATFAREYGRPSPQPYRSETVDRTLQPSPALAFIGLLASTVADMVAEERALGGTP